MNFNMKGKNTIKYYLKTICTQGDLKELITIDNSIKRKNWSSGIFYLNYSSCLSPKEKMKPLFVKSNIV